MKSSPEKPVQKQEIRSESPQKHRVGPEKTAVSEKYSGREDVYAPDVEEAIQQLKDMLANREILLADLLQTRNNGDENATKKIADDLETIERLIREFSAKLAENVDIERHNLQHLHEWLTQKTRNSISGPIA